MVKIHWSGYELKKLKNGEKIKKCGGSEKNKKCHKRPLHIWMSLNQWFEPISVGI